MQYNQTNQNDKTTKKLIHQIIHNKQIIQILLNTLYRNQIVREFSLLLKISKRKKIIIKNILSMLLIIEIQYKIKLKTINLMSNNYSSKKNKNKKN